MARWIAPLLVTVTFFGLLTVGFWQARKHLPNPKEWARLLETELQATLSVPVKVGSAEISLNGATIRNLMIQPDSRSPTGYVLTVPELKLRWSLWQILRPSQWKQVVQAQIERVLHQVIIANATLFLWRDRKGRWNVQTFFAQQPTRPAARVPALQIRDGTLIIGDETLPLPNGLPFKLKLVNVQAKVRPVDSGTHIEAEGRIASPLGLDGSKASLTIVQVGNEVGQDSRGRLTAKGIKVAALPQQIRSFGDGRVNLLSGKVDQLVLNWQQKDTEAELSGSALLNDTIAKLAISKPSNLSPLDAALSFSVRLADRRIRNWHLTVRTLKTHPQLGEGMLAAEGRRNFWLVRWRGEGLKLAIIRSFVTQPLPLTEGNLSGDFAAESKGSRFRVDANLSIRRTRLQPTDELRKLQIPTIAVSSAKTQVHMERRGKRWVGSLEVFAKTEVGQAKAEVWVSGGEGRGRVQIANLHLAPFYPVALNLLPTHLHPYARLKGGMVSGTLTVSWRGRKWRLDELKVKFYQTTVVSDKLPDLKFSGQIQSDGKTFRILSVRVNLDSNAFAFLSGQTTLARTPIWQVQGQISPSAMERLAAWAQAKLKLPVNLVQSGQAQVGLGGVGTQWQVQLSWNEPFGLVNLQNLKWQTQLGRLTLLASPQGATAFLNEATANLTNQRIVADGSVFQLAEGVQFSEWRCIWDEKKKLLFAYGSVKVPNFGFNGLALENARADLEFALSLADKPSAELRAINIQANLLDGTLSNGRLLLVSHSKEKFAFNASARLQEVDIGKITGWLEKRAGQAFSAKGKFSGSIFVNAQVPKSLQLSLEGILSGLKANNGNEQLRAQKLTVTNLTVAAERNGNGWLIRQVAGEGIGQNLVSSANGKDLKVERVHFQGFAKRSESGWLWDLRLPQVRVWNGKTSGQAKGTPETAESHFSFADLDIAQLAKFAGLKLEGDLPKGKGSGWLKLLAEKRNGKWQGDFEGASLLTEASWNEWNVKMAGARVRGKFLADEKLSLQHLSGKVEGIHLLSEDGQAVLSGTFAFKEKVASLMLSGKWTGVSLRRLSRRFELPVQIQGFAEGTVQILWDGNWQISGTANSQAVGVGESALWRDVSGEWVWQGNEIRLKQVQVKWGDGALKGEGIVRTSPNAPTTLTVQAKGVALSDLSRLLQEWRLPLSDWHWYGQANGQIWLSVTNGRVNLTVSLDGQRVRFGSAQLGRARLDLTVDRRIQGDETLVSASGILNLRSNGMVVTAEFDGVQPNWQIRWKGGNVPIEALRLIANDWKQRLSKEASTILDQWLNLPLRGEVWSEGEVSVAEGKIARMQASFHSPNLWGIGELPTQANLTVERTGKLWVVRLKDLRQGVATAVGMVSVADSGEISGELVLKQVSPELAASLAKFLGAKFEAKSLPEGVLSAQLKLAGTTEKPVIEGTLQAGDVYWRGWTARQIFVRRFELRDGTLKVEKGDGIIRWRTGASLASFWGWINFNGKRQMLWRIEMPPTPLDAVLPPDLPLQIENGWLSGSMSLQGSWDEPRLKGSLEMFADAVQFAKNNSLPQSLEPLSKLRDVRFQVEADGRRARLTKFVAHWSTGELIGSGWMELGEGGLQNLFANKGELTLRAKDVKTKLQATNLNLEDATFKGKLDGNGLMLIVESAQGDGFSVQGSVSWVKMPKDRWEWISSGKWDLTLRLSDFRWQFEGARGELSGYLTLRSQRESEPPTLVGNLTIHDGDILRLPVVAAGGDGKWQFPPALRLALRLEIGDKFFLRNPQASLMLDGELQLAGDLSQPRLEGELRSQRGTLRLPATVLTITDMGVRVAYAVDPLTRQWLGTARLRVEGETQLDIHRIIFTASGPIDAQSQRLGILPSVTLLATPPLPEQTALERMFGLGLAQLGEALTNWQQLFSGALVQSFMGNLLVPLTEPIAQALRWTELTVIREQTTGRQWLRLGIPLAPRLHVLWRHGFSPADPSALEVQYYLGKRTSVTVTKREREQAEIRIQTSVRF
ncbi:AsmA-like C-terminal region [Candidatus Fervidibacteria bacterium JGI MDM2 SSWTFF-3-K9]